MAIPHMNQIHEMKSLQGCLEKKEKYYIIIWGAGDTARETLKYQSDTVEVLGFLDNNPDIKEFEGFRALEKSIVYNGDYDFIVICSRSHEEIYEQLLEMGVQSERILINPIHKAQIYFIYQSDFFARKWNALAKRRKIEIYISGISYHNDGIQDSVFAAQIGKEAFNLANRGQDIFYDYQIAKLLDREKLLKDTTHYIIGLCYYSFDYDLSRTGNGWEIIRYYPYITDSHNLISDDTFEAFVHDTKEYMEKNEIYYRLFDKTPVHVVSDEQGQKEAKIDFKKNNPLTVWENKVILKQFLSFLIDRAIKPIIVIMPAIEGYVKGCPQAMKQRFYDSLEECTAGLDIQVLDYFGRYYTDSSEYYHVSHFNRQGAEKFTKKLIQDIIW